MMDRFDVVSTKVGEHKGSSRIYLQGKYLDRAGFKPSLKLNMQVCNDRIELTVGDEGRNTISKKKSNGALVPVIDILSSSFSEILGDHAEVKVTQGKLTLKPNRISRSNSRTNDKSEIVRTGSIFSGGGFLSLAAKLAGEKCGKKVKEVFGIEINPKYAEVFADNNPEAIVFNQSVHEVNTDDLPQIDLLTIGLPCEPYSTSRRSGAGYDKNLPPEAHELGDMVFWALRIVDILAEKGLKSVILEEAPNFLKAGAGYIMINSLKRMGFNVSADVLDSKDYGSIQSRKRTVIVASKDEFTLPDKSECQSTLGDILEDASQYDHDWFDKESKAWLYNHWEKQSKKGNNFAKGLIKSSFDKNIQALKKRYFAGQGDNPVIAHPTNPEKHRWLTITEFRRLFEVPDSYKLGCPKTTLGEILGQGVVVGLFKQIIEAVISPISKSTIEEVFPANYQPLLFAV
jgi:DNA (cytosine-5)-methyltransferase 1